MIAFKNIILTTDLSQMSDAAAPYAVDFAQKYDGLIHLVHVFEDLIFYPPTLTEAPLAVDVSEVLRETHAERATKLDQHAKDLSQQYGVQVVPVLLRGHAGNEIVSYAKRENIDLIVTATHGRGGISHLIFGSVAERVVRTSYCPVMTVRPAEHKK